VSRTVLREAWGAVPRVYLPFRHEGTHWRGCRIGTGTHRGGTAANVNDVTQAHALLHGEESDVFSDAGYQGVERRTEAQDIEVNWHVAMRPGKRRALDKEAPVGKLRDELERVKARIRAKVEHPFRIIKRQFGYLKVRYRGLMKNTQQLHTLFALSNLWMMRHRLQPGAKR